jgi:lipopolysaccharide export system permease protein
LGILQRHILRELAASFLAVFGVLAAIMLVYQGGAVLARAVEMQYPAGVVWELFGLALVQRMVLLLPLALLLAIVLTLGRLYSDNELFAAQACGFGRQRLRVVVMMLGAPLALAAAWLTLSAAPRAATAELELRAAALRSSLQVPIVAGQFRSMASGRAVVYARSVSADGDLQDVFVKRMSGEGIEVTVARRARTGLSADGLSQTITLQDGERREGRAGEANWRTMRFAELVVPLVLPTVTSSSVDRTTLPTAQIWGSEAATERAELHGRLGWPLMILMLSVIAIPVSRLRPRQARFSKIWIALLIFALYVSLLQAGILWLQNGQTPAALGLWWVHALFALLAMVFLSAPSLRLRMRTPTPMKAA